jgi:hypothetical protein
VRRNNMRTYYIVVISYHTYYCEITGTKGRRKPIGIFASLKDAEEFIESAPDYDFNRDAELYYKIHPIVLNMYPEEDDED